MKKLGFTLIELLIAIAIVGTLAAIAIPYYQSYVKRAHYSELIHATAPYKLGVAECYQISGDLNSCASGKNGIPANFSSSKGAGLVKSITVKKNGKITVVPQEKYGINSKDTYDSIIKFFTRLDSF